MPLPSGPASPDAQIATLRQIANGEALAADHAAAVQAMALGHVEHDGEAWRLTNQGGFALDQVMGAP